MTILLGSNSAFTNDQQVGQEPGLGIERLMMLMSIKLTPFCSLCPKRPECFRSTAYLNWKSVGCYGQTDHACTGRLEGLHKSPDKDGLRMVKLRHNSIPSQVISSLGYFITPDALHLSLSRSGQTKKSVNIHVVTCSTALQPLGTWSYNLGLQALRKP